MDPTSIPDCPQARTAARRARARGVRHLAFALLALALAGCATRHEFGNFGQPLNSSVGQLRYAYGDRTVIGEVSLHRNPRGTRLEFTKAGNVVLMRVLVDATHIRFEGPLARGDREYPLTAKLPEHLVSWAELAQSAPTAGPKTLARGQETMTAVLPPFR